MEGFVKVGELARAVAGRSGQRAPWFFVGGDALGNGIAVNAQSLGGFGKVLFVSGKGLFDVEPLEFAYCLGQQNVAVEHFVDQSFKSRTHVKEPSFFG